MTESAATLADGRHDFDFLFGDWHVHHRYLAARLVGATEWVEFEGTARCQPILGGQGNVDEIDMPSRGLVGATVRLYDPTAGTWSLHWTSSATGRFEPPVHGGFVAGRGVFEGEDTHGAVRIRVRYVWDRIGPRTARWRQSFSIDEGRTWELNWTMTFSRAT